MASLPLPLRLALVAVLVLAGAWTVLLRPAAEVPVEPPIPPAAPAQAEAAEPKPKPVPARRAAPRDPSAPVLAALDEGRAAVLLFTDGRAEEDRQAVRVVAGLDRRGGRVLVRRAPMASVGRYEAITRGVPVAASPTILVIGPSRTARTITGLTTPAEVGQAVADALDLSADPLGEARFRRAQAVRRAERTCAADPCVKHFTAANDVCLDAAAKAAQGATDAGGLAALQAARASVAGVATAFAAVPAPRAQRAGHRRAAGLLQRQVVVLDRALASSKDAGVVRRRIERSATLRSTDRELRRLGYLACG